MTQNKKTNAVGLCVVLYTKPTYNYFHKAGRKYPCAIPTFSSVPLSIDFLQKTNCISRTKVQVIGMLCKTASFQLMVVVTLTDFL